MNFEEIKTGNTTVGYVKFVRGDENASARLERGNVLTFTRMFDGTFLRQRAHNGSRLILQGKDIDWDLPGWTDKDRRAVNKISRILVNSDTTDCTELAKKIWLSIRRRVL